MKLMYDLPQADKAVYEAAAAGEKMMYCIPFNIYEEKYVDGRTVVTDKHIFLLLNGQILRTVDLAECTVFSTEDMYGSCAFYACINGATHCLCRFESAHYLSRYCVLVRACEDLAERLRKHEKPGDPFESNELEKFCPQCGHHYLTGTQFCLYCRNSNEVYKKFWAMTKGLDS